MTAATSCRTCGAEPLENARFCHGCGSPVAGVDSHAEYKQVTVLFADVVHSMDIAAAVGAERLREIMAQLVDTATAVVRHFGGTVDKFTGDGIMAVFGAPIALEDHGVRACLAALGIQNECVRLAAEAKRRDGIDLQLRVGLNSGQVIAGEIGSGLLGYTAIGEQVGMAQRMESVASPGGVMLSESTARMVEDVAVLDDRELVYVKGRVDPVSARRLRAISVQRGRPSRREVTLIGRQVEITEVAEMLDGAIDGSGGVVGIVGPAGIGKSRLVRETAEMASSLGMAVFSTFCQSHTRGIAFHAATGLHGRSSTPTALTPTLRVGECVSCCRTPTSKICSCSTTCSVLATSAWARSTSTRMPGVGGDAVVQVRRAGADHTDSLCDRGRPLAR